MCATFASGGSAGSELIRIPWDIKNPHLSSSIMAFNARECLFSNSCQLVAINANRTLSDTLNDQCLGSVNESLIPFGSSSKFEPENTTLSSLDFTAWISLPEISKIPPSTDLISSCVIEGVNSDSISFPEYASQRPFHCSTKFV